MEADAKKTTLRMIPYGLYVLTAETDDSVGCRFGDGQLGLADVLRPAAAGNWREDRHQVLRERKGWRQAGDVLPRSGQGSLAFAFFGDAEIEGDEFVTKDARIGFERTDGGAIVLTDAPAWAELKLRDTVEIGDHAVVVVEVTDVGLREDDPKMLTLSELGLNYGG